MAKFKLYVLTFVSGFAFLGLSVWGEGGFSAFFSHPALIAVVIAGLAMSALAPFTKGNISSGVREDRSNRWVFVVFTLVALVGAYLPAYMDRIDLWTVDGDAARWIGAFLFTVGGALRMWPVFVLGNRFSGLVAIQQGHQLVTTGIYRVIRHPSYAGLIVNFVGWSLAFRSSVGLALTFVTVVTVLARIRSEEALLRSHFGSEYEAFCKQTPWRLIPGIY